MAAATSAMACSPDEHCLLTVRTGTSSGMPAKKDAMRASFARWLLGPSTEPTTMSPRDAGSSRVASSTALNTVDSRSTASVSFRPPRLALVSGVRSAATITTSSRDVFLRW